jgi:hypothetical protein
MLILGPCADRNDADFFSCRAIQHMLLFTMQQ